MSKALDLANELHEMAMKRMPLTGMNVTIALAQSVAELRRLAEIERKYDEIMAQEPVAWLNVLDCGGGDWEYTFHALNERTEGKYHIYTLPKD